MDFGLQAFPPPTPGTDLARHFAAVLERLPRAFTTVWLPDHFQFGAEPVLESWVWLSFLAGAHPRFRFGHLVLAQSYRSPALVAKMAATLACLTNGRYVLGLGAGWKEDEYNSYGYEFPSPGIRVAQLSEAVELIRVMWSQSPATYAGTYYRVTEAMCEPRPSAPIPILIGTNGPRALRIAARFADMWNWDGPWDTYRGPLDVLRTACEEIGRPFEEIELTAGVEVDFRPDSQRAAICLGPTSDDVIRELGLLASAGVSHVQVAFPDLDAIDRFVAEVVPAFEIGAP